VFAYVEYVLAGKYNLRTTPTCTVQCPPLQQRRLCRYEVRLSKQQTTETMSSSIITNTTTSGGSSFRKLTVADGISRTDDGYVPSSNRGPRSGVCWEDASTHSGAMEDATIPSTFTALSQRRSLKKSHEGEWHGDPGHHPVKMRWKTYLYAACAALNSCNMGYDMVRLFLFFFRGGSVTTYVLYSFIQFQWFYFSLFGLLLCVCVFFCFEGCYHRGIA